MNSKQRFDAYNKFKPNARTEEQKVRSLINDLIQALYIPVAGDNERKVDPVRLKAFGVDDTEPINWGALKCVDVQKFENGSFLATIDEASPGDCPSLCEYITTYMMSWGWQVRVQTEW